MNIIRFLFISLVAAVALAASDDDDIFLGEDHKSGFVDLGDGDDIFYWLFNSRSDKDADPLVIWLTGGPGCSSEVATFLENGPFNINEDLSLSINPHSWNNRSNLLYVDQPIGTGFSKCSNPFHYVTNEHEVAEHMYLFMVGFLEAFPEYKGRAMYITGESYAGHYIPAISAYFVEQQNEDVNLQAVAIGNGWVSPYYQYPQYAEFSRENDLIYDFHYYILKWGYALCQVLIKTRFWFIALEECQIMTTTVLGLPFAPRFNVYDIRIPCENPPLCYDMSRVGQFLDRSDVREILGVGDRKWTECDMIVHTFMLGDWVTDLSKEVKYLLDNNVDVLVYSGDKDFICNWRGGEAWTHELVWDGQEEFVDTEYKVWEVDGLGSGGEVKSHKGLTFLRVYNAGHMVPMDQPEFSTEMLKHYLYKTFHLIQ